MGNFIYFFGLGFTVLGRVLGVCILNKELGWVLSFGAGFRTLGGIKKPISARVTLN